ncbi:DUF4405 domain-containing protein [Roseateles sp.]|uniref:DUF4405 domain-containing protein n=1 Tax=Roseateles sp. TaxID=1971397 RepID=UPI003BA744C7
MWRRLTAMGLLISFVAMATSGMMMFVVEKPSFTIAMHPVHKLFGLLMVVCACSHIWLNRRAIGQHIRQRSGAMVVVMLTVLLTVLYGVVINTDRNGDTARELDRLGQKFEHQR